MAITLVTHPVEGWGFIANANSPDWQGNEEICAAVAGKSIYIERILLHCIAAEVYTIQEATTVLLGPFSMANTSFLNLEFTRPLKLTPATALNMDATGAGDGTIVVQGFIK